MPHHIEGIRGKKDNGPTTTSSQRYSNKAMIQIRPTEQWGFCDTGHDKGYTNIVTYQHQLDLTKGLYLEMYHDEKHKINYRYVMVEINMD